MVTRKKPSTAWEPGKPSPNPRGRPADKLKGLTTAEGKIMLSKLKKIGPKAVQTFIDAYEEATGESKATLARELIKLYMAFDTHTIRRAKEMANLIAEMDNFKSEKETKDSAASFEPEDKPVFSLHMNRDEE